MSKRKKGKRQSYTVLKKMRTRFWNENPNCFYCKQLTVLPTDIPDLLELQTLGITPDNMATVEHLHTRYDDERFEDGGENKCVLACYKCNHEKEIERAALVPKEELQKRSNRFPLSKFVTNEIKKEIVDVVFGDKKFVTSEEVESFVVSFFKKNDLMDMKEKYNIQRRYLAGTIKQHMNNLKKELNHGKQKTEVEKAPSGVQGISL